MFARFAICRPVRRAEEQSDTELEVFLYIGDNELGTDMSHKSICLRHTLKHWSVFIITVTFSSPFFIFFGGM